MIIDTHSHLYFPGIVERLDQVIDNAIKAGLTRIVNIGTNVPTSKLALQQAIDISAGRASDKVKVFSTIGIHPHEAVKYFSSESVSIQEDINRLGELYRGYPHQIVAVGECGLDYHFAPNPGFNPPHLSPDQIKELQRQLFKSQVSMAISLNLPLVIHCRNAWTEIFDFLQNSSLQSKSLKGVFHCFSGSLEDAKKAIQSHFYISFAGNITYPKNNALQEVALQIPLDRILVETDCPFLAPEGKRGEVNEPVGVTWVIKTIAKIKQLSENEVINQTFDNAQRVFSI